MKFFEEKKKAKAILGAVGVGTFLWVLILYPGLWWVLVLLVGAALGLGFFLGEGFLRRGLAEIPQPSVPEPPVALIQSAEVVGVELPSAEEGYLFRFSANVRYQGTPTGQHGNPAQVAALALLERARELTRDYRPEEHTIAQYRLAAVLGEPVVDAATGLTVWANNVVLTLVEEDIQRLQRLSSFRKDLRIWEREQEVEQVRRDALGTTLSSPAQALLWWLARDSKARPRPEELREAARLVEAFSRMSETISGREEAAFSPWWIGSDWQDRADRPDAVTGSISYQQACALVDSLPEGHHVFADRLANLLEWQGHEDTARYLRERYLLPEQDWDEPVAEKRDGSDPQETVSMSEPSRLNGASPFTPGPDAAPGPAGG